MTMQTAVQSALEGLAELDSGPIPVSVPEIAGNEWAYLKDCLDSNWVSSVGPCTTGSD